MLASVHGARGPGGAPSLPTPAASLVAVELSGNAQWCEAWKGRSAFGQSISITVAATVTLFDEATKEQLQLQDRHLPQMSPVVVVAFPQAAAAHGGGNARSALLEAAGVMQHDVIFHVQAQLLRGGKYSSLSHFRSPLSFAGP